MKTPESGPRTFSGHAVYALMMVCLAWLPGCSTSSKKDSGPKHIFYPPPPQPARLQFLVSFSEENDLGRRQSKLARLVTGVEPVSQAILKPYGVAQAGGRIYVCDTGARAVQVLDLEKRTMESFAPGGMGKLGTPVNLAVDQDGTRYIADTSRNQVLVFSSDGSFLGAIGEKEGLRPTSVALTKDRVYVADLNGHCVRVYDKSSHTPLFTIPRKPAASQEDEPGKLFMPANLTVDAQGQVYVSDTAACQIQVYTADGKHLLKFGVAGDLPGQFARPKGVAVDREGRIFVVDAATQVCQIFDAEGRLLLFFGEPEGSKAPLNLPAGISVDYDLVPLFEKYAAPGFVIEQLVLISNQYGPDKVSIYGLGHKK